MIGSAVILNASTGVKNFLDANLLQRPRCGNSFLAFGQGSGRKAF